MKKILLVFVCILSITIAKSQTDQQEPEIKTLFGGIESHGFYLGMSGGYASIDGRDAVLMGGRLAWILNHKLAMGFAGNGFITEYKYDQALSSNAGFAGGMGGFFIEPIFFPEFPVHFSVPVLIGAGGMGYGKTYDYENNNDYGNHHYNVEDASAFMFVKPGIELELNMIKFMRLSLGAYYLQTSNISINSAKSDILNGFSGMVTLKFGKF